MTRRDVANATRGTVGFRAGRSLSRAPGQRGPQVDRDTKSERRRTLPASTLAYILQALGAGICLVGLWHFAQDYWIMEGGFIVIALGIIVGWFNR